MYTQDTGNAAKAWKLDLEKSNIPNGLAVFTRKLSKPLRIRCQFRSMDDVPKALAWVLLKRGQGAKGKEVVVLKLTTNGISRYPAYCLA